MYASRDISTILWRVSVIVGELGETSGSIPLIGGWCKTRLWAISDQLSYASTDIGYLDGWFDAAAARMSQLLDWDQVSSRISSTWTWLNTIDDKIFQRVRSVWPWIDDVDGAINRYVGSKWSWLNSIDDRIKDTVSSRWTWLNTIDDRIRDIAWSHIAPKLGDWFWSFIVLNVTLVSKLGYRVLSTLWNMEWDDANKEAK